MQYILVGPEWDLVTDYLYSLPQDKQGLLLHQKKQALNRVVDELEMILVDYGASSVLDCCGDGLYAAELARIGQQVSAADESPDAEELIKQRLDGKGRIVPLQQANIFSPEQAYPEKFDAILFMNSELARYEDPEAVLQILFSRLNENGILVLGVLDLENLPREKNDQDDYGKDTFTPLLLGEEYEGKRYSVIRNMRHDIVMEWVAVNYIYHIQKLDTGAIIMDREAAKYSPISRNTIYMILPVNWINTYIRIFKLAMSTCLFAEPSRPGAIWDRLPIRQI